MQYFAVFCLHLIGVCFIEFTGRKLFFPKKFNTSCHLLYLSIQKLHFLETVLHWLHLWPESKCYLDSIFFFLDKHLILFLCEQFRENNFLKLLGELRWAGGFLLLCLLSLPLSYKGTSQSSCGAGLTCPAQWLLSGLLGTGSTHPTGSSAQIVHRLLLSSLCCL